MGLADQHFLARMGRSGDPDLTAGDQARQSGELLPVGGRRRRVIFQIAGKPDVGRAKRGEPFAIALALGEAEIDARQQRADETAQPAPAPERTRAETGVDENDRNLRPFGLDDEIRPEFGFGEQGDIGPPMRDEAAHEAGDVERHELMEGAGRQAIGEDRRRSDGSGGDQHVAAALGQFLDQRQQRQSLADAGAMQPDQDAGGPLKARLAAPLADPRAVLLAARQPPGQQRPAQGREGAGRQTIGDERKRQFHTPLKPTPELAAAFA